MQIEHPITEDDIVDFLVNTPDFFERHASLLATVQLASPHSKRAVSLQERQAEMMREKIKGLELKLAEMVRHGQDNVVIADRLHQWTCEVLLHAQPEVLPLTIAEGMKTIFSVPQTAIKVWDVRSDLASASFAQGASSQVQSFASSLAVPYCGAKADFEALNWLENPTEMASIALIPLRDKQNPTAPAFGLLVLASPDTARFQTDMGTAFLERIGELASAALSRLR